MIRLKHLIVALLFLALVPVVRAAEEEVPDEAATRKQVNDLIKSFKDQKHKATLGLVQQTAGISISFGAPAYNNGDRAACSRFYVTTAQALCDAFPEEATSADAREALADMRRALERIKGSTDADRNAWAIRFAWDKAQLASTLEASRGEALVQIGEEYFKRAEFIEAEDAFRASVAVLHELDGMSPDRIAAVGRFAPLALADALFAQKKFKEAADSIVVGLTYVPDWPLVKQDARSLWGDPADYEAAMDELLAQSEKQPQEATLHFLLGYEYYFTGKRTAAATQFQRTLELDAKHAGAKKFLEQLDRKQTPEPGKPAPARA